MTTGMIRWHPRRDTMRTHFSRLFDEAFNDFLSPMPTTEEARERAWMPAVDIREDGDNVTLYAELPGLKKDDVNLSLEDRVLTLTGERKFQHETEKDNYHRIERAYGTFSRSFVLPNNVDPSRAEAKFEDGILTVTLPKVEEAKPRSINIL